MGKKKILFHVDSWYGRRNAGSESYLNTIAKYLVSKGHQVRVLTAPSMASNGEDRGGISFFTNTAQTDELYDWCDIVSTQIAFTPMVAANNKKHKKKFLYIIHNNKSVNTWDLKAKEVTVALYCADWIKNFHNEQAKWKPENEMVFYPPVLFDEYKITDPDILEKRKYITLVNRSREKGAYTLNQAARDLPQWDFLAVKGGYGDQMNKFKTDNVSLLNHTNNMVRDVYSRSKVVIMPSIRETWGMVAIEAMCSGIPVVAHPTEGLQESCGSAGIFIHRDKGRLWEKELDRLMSDPMYYRQRSMMSLERAQELDIIARRQLDELERFLDQL